MQVKTKYKQAEVGLIPYDWSETRLEELFELKNGFAFSSEHFSNSGPIVLTPGNFRLCGGLYFEERNTKRYSASYDPSLAFSNGDLLIVMTDLTPDCNLLGRPAFVQSEEIILHNQRIGKVVLRQKSVDPLLLFYILLSRPYLSKIREMATGSTVRHTSSKCIYSVKVALPPPVEQLAIAAALSDVDALINSLDRLITKKRHIKQATMQQLLMGKKRLPGFKKQDGFKQTEIGLIPEDWDLKTFGALTVLLTNGFVGKATDFYEKADAGVLYIQGYNVEPNSFNFHGIKRISQDFHNRHQRSCLQAGDLLTIQTGDIGVTTEVPPALAGSNCHALVISRLVKQWAYPGYYCYYFNSARGKAMFKEIETGTTMKHLNISDMAKLFMPVPSRSEQIAIATTLSDMDVELSALERRHDKTVHIKQGMMQELLTGRTRLL